MGISSQRGPFCRILRAFSLAAILAAPCAWGEMKNFKNRQEGTRPFNNGKFDFLLLGIHRGFESFPKNATLRVRFAVASGETSPFVNARELIIREHYAMIGKSFK